MPRAQVRIVAQGRGAAGVRRRVDRRARVPGPSCHDRVRVDPNSQERTLTFGLVLAGENLSTAAETQSLAAKGLGS